MDSEKLKTEAAQMARQLKDAAGGIFRELFKKDNALRADRLDRDAQAFQTALRSEAEKIALLEGLEMRSACAYPCVHVRQLLQDRFGERPRDVAMYREMCTHQGEVLFAHLYGKKGAKERPPSMEAFLIDFAAFANKLWNHGAPRKLLDAHAMTDPVERKEAFARLFAQYFAVGQDAKRKAAASPDGFINSWMKLNADIEAQIRRATGAAAAPASSGDSQEVRQAAG